MKNLARIVSATLLVFPLVTLARAPGNLTDLIVLALNLINDVIKLLSALAVLYFVWNTVQFIAHADDVKARAEGQQGMLYGIIGLFVLFSFWGIVQFLQGAVFK